MIVTGCLMIYWIYSCLQIMKMFLIQRWFHPFHHTIFYLIIFNSHYHLHVPLLHKTLNIQTFLHRDHLAVFKEKLFNYSMTMTIHVVPQFGTRLSSGLSQLSSGPRQVSNWDDSVLDWVVSVLDQDMSQFWTKTCLSSKPSHLSSGPSRLSSGLLYKMSIMTVNYTFTFCCCHM